MFKRDVLYGIQDYERYVVESEFLSPVLHPSHFFSLEARVAAEVLCCVPGMWKVPSSSCVYPGSVHYNPQAKCGRLPIFVESLLEHSHSHPFRYCLWLLLCYNNSIATETICPTKPKILVICPFTEKFAKFNSQIACV